MYTPENIIPSLNSLMEVCDRGQRSWKQLYRLLEKARAEMYKDPSFGNVLTQAEVDNMINSYSPKYFEKLTQIETVADELGTDLFH